MCSLTLRLKTFYFKNLFDISMDSVKRLSVDNIPTVPTAFSASGKEISGWYPSEIVNSNPSGDMNCYFRKVDNIWRGEGKKQ